MNLVRLTALFAGILLCFNCIAAEYLSHKVDNQSLVIATDTGKVTLTAFSDSAIEVFYQPDHVKQLPSFAIDGLPESTIVSVKNELNTLVFSTSSISAEITKSPFSISYKRDNELIVEEEIGLFVQDTVRGFRFKLTKQEKLMGGGQRVLGMDRRGHRMPLYNKAHYGYTTESNQMYYSLPAVLSNKKYALVFDNSARGNLDIGYTEKDILQFDAVGGRTSYLLIVGENYPDLLANFTGLTGKQPLPPRWALGNFASRFGYRSAAEAKSTVKAFQDNDFPLDAIVFDLFWFGPDFKGYMGNLDWDLNAFPEPESLVDSFASQGIQTVLISEPFVLTTSKNWQYADQAGLLAKNNAGQSRVFDFFFGETGLIDVFNQEAEIWFSDAYKRLYNQGVRGWWGDLGEPEVHPSDALHQLGDQTATADEVHNAYGHKWAKLVYETQRNLDNSTRPMVMMRSGFVGSQRYGMIPWTGDVSRSWGGLKPQVELSLQMSMFGLAYTHSDLGGFAGGEAFDREMYIRWLQYGVFQPIYRPHAQENIAPEPIFHDQLTKDILREYVKLRYRLLPYNYSLAFQNSQTGMPLMRPMVFEDESNDGWFDINDQYLWGDAFLIKPVTEPGAESVQMILPEGVWFDFWQDTKYVGTTTAKIKTRLDHLPVLVRAGAFVPMVEPVSSTMHYSTEELILHYYHDESVSLSKYQMFDDNGNDPNALTALRYQKLDFTFQQSDEIVTISLDKTGDFPGAPERRNLTLVVHNWQSLPSLVRLGNQRLRLLSNDKELSLQEQGAWYDKNSKLLKVRIPWSENTFVQIK